MIADLPDDDKTAVHIHQLEQMGFTFQQSMRALKLTNNSFPRALDYLLNGSNSEESLNSINANSSNNQSNRRPTRLVNFEPQSKFKAASPVGISQPNRRSNSQSSNQSNSSSRGQSNPLGNNQSVKTESMNDGSDDEFSPDTVFQGTVAGVNHIRGFAFIKPSSKSVHKFPDGHQGDVFCHLSNVSDDQLLNDGDQVRFQLMWNVKKELYQADNVSVIRFSDPSMKGMTWNSLRAQRTVNKRGRDEDPLEYQSFSANNGQPTSSGPMHQQASGFILSINNADRSGRVYLSTTKPKYVKYRVLDFSCYSVSHSSSQNLLPGDRVVFRLRPGDSIQQPYKVLELKCVNSQSMRMIDEDAHSHAAFFNSLEPSQQEFFSTLNKCGHRKTNFIHGSHVQSEESRHVEFKSLARSQNPDKWIRLYSEKYTSSFLNSEGGFLYMGISDSGVVEGLSFDTARRDKVRLIIDSAMSFMSPRVDTKLYSITFHPVWHKVDVPHELIDRAVNQSIHPSQEYTVDERSSVHFCVPLIDVFVLSLAGKPAPDEIYFTSGDVHDDRQRRAYLRRDGGTHEMSTAMVASRSQATAKEREERLKREILSQVNNMTRRRENQYFDEYQSINQSINQSIGQSSNQQSQRLISSLRDQFLSMGVDQSIVLQVVFELEKQGKFRADANQEALIAEMWDRCEQAQSINQSVSQSAGQPSNQLANQSQSLSIKHEQPMFDAYPTATAVTPTNQIRPPAINPSFNSSFSQSVNQSITPSTTSFVRFPGTPPRLAVIPSNDQLMTQSVNQPVSNSSMSASFRHDQSAVTAALDAPFTSISQSTNQSINPSIHQSFPPPSLLPRLQSDGYMKDEDETVPCEICSEHVQFAQYDDHLIQCRQKRAAAKQAGLID